MLAALGVFACAAALLLALALPGEWSPSPAALAAGSLRRKIYGWLLRGDRALAYELAGRSPEEVLKRAAVLGPALGALVLALCWRVLGALSLLPALALAAAVLVALDAAVANECRRWRERLADGVPALVAFVPAFLETGVITPRRALEAALPFLPEPLRSELGRALGPLARKGSLEALDELRKRAADPLVDAVCFRLKAGWDAGIGPDVFEDLAEQIRNAQEVAAARATAARGGLLALVCVVGLLGAALVFGYPAWKHIAGTMGGMFR